MKVSIIILHFGDLLVTRNCVDSLYSQETYAFSLIVVNNMPLPITQSDFPKKNIEIINNKKNLGFSGGVNVGIRHALSQKADAIMLLNNDTILEKPILKKLVETLFKNQTVGIVAPALEFKKHGKTFYDIGGSVNAFGKTSHREVLSTTPYSTNSVTYVSGCCMLIKPEVFEKIGSFDDNFFLYYEDVDFCLRAKKAGFGIKVIPSVSLYHELSKSSGRLSRLSIYHQIRSALLFGKKHYNSSPNRILQMLFVIFQTLIFLKASPKNTVFALDAWAAAF